MRLKSLGVAMLACASITAGCGSESDTSTDAAPTSIAEIDVQTGPFDSKEQFVSAVSDYCDQANAVFNRYPVYGVSPAGLVAEYETRVRLDGEDVAKTTSIKAPDEVADDWATYTDADQALLASDKAVLDAAKADDAEKANELMAGDAATAINDLIDTSDKLGLSCFDTDAPLSAAEPGGATGAAADAPQPANTIEEAADEWLAATQSGDCKQIVAATHTQNYPSVDAIADPATGDCSVYATNSKSTEVADTAQFGPVGMAAFKYGPGQYSYEEFVLDPDNGDKLTHTGSIYGNTVGLDPAPESNNADEQIDAFVQAIRDNDPKALNPTITVESPGPGEGGFPQDGPFNELGSDPVYAKTIVSDIRADDAAAPQLMGQNQIWSTYMLEANGHDYVLFATHQPGSVDDYGVNAYWALDSAKGGGGEAS